MITQNDFSCIGLIAQHCDLPKLCIAIEEAKIFDIMPLTCDSFFFDIETNLTNVSYQNLWNGGFYLGCNNKQQFNQGLKKAFVFYAYSRYVLINGFNDTAVGMVQKTNEFSIPKPYNEIKAFSDKYRTMGFDAWESVKKYLCTNKDLFINFEAVNCKCECTDCDGATKKNYDSTSKIISKYD